MSEVPLQRVGPQAGEEALREAALCHLALHLDPE